MENLLKHHIEETGRRFSELRVDLKDFRSEVKEGFESVDKQIQGLSAFKAEITARTKVVSTLWGAGWGLLTLIASVILKKYLD